MTNTSRGSVKDYVSFEDETFRASSISSGVASSANRYISKRCMGAPPLRTNEILDEINKYIESQIEPETTRGAREFVAKNMIGKSDDVKIDAYTKRKGDYRREIGKEVMSDIRKKPIEDFLSDVGDFIIAGSSKTAQSYSV